MIIFDSSVWVALFNYKDSQHQQAKAVISRKSRELVIHEYIISEVCTVLAQKASKDLANSFLEYITDNQDVSLLFSNPDFFTAVVDKFTVERSEQLSFIDVSLLYLSRQYEVVTFDKKLAKAISEDS